MDGLHRDAVRRAVVESEPELFVNQTTEESSPRAWTLKTDPEGRRRQHRGRSTGGGHTGDRSHIDTTISTVKAPQLGLLETGRQRSRRATSRSSATAPAGTRSSTSATPWRPPRCGRQGRTGHRQRRGRQPALPGRVVPHRADMLDAPPRPRISEEEAEKQIGVQTSFYGNQLRAARNAKANSELGLAALEYPPWREGFGELFRLTAAGGTGRYAEQHGDHGRVIGHDRSNRRGWERLRAKYPLMTTSAATPTRLRSGHGRVP